MSVKSSSTKYLEIRTTALIECLRRSKKKDLSRRGSEEEDTIYTLASKIARAAETDTKTLAADLAHKLEIEYPHLSANLFTHNIST